METRLIFAFIFHLLTIQWSFAQVLKVNHLADSVSREPIMMGVALVFPETGSDTLKVEGGFTGEFIFNQIKPGNYTLVIKPNLPGVKVSTQKINVSTKDTTIIDKIGEICNQNYVIKACPKSHLKYNVIRVQYNIVSMPYFDNEKDYTRFGKRLRKQGYRTIFHGKNEEVLIYIHDPDLDELLTDTDACDKYLFCKRHKIVFQ
tara:strand:- start:7 stop:615 length:609 start_codon:yes stop_codon:yes gene_type:complete